MRRPYQNYDKEIHDQIQVIYKDTADLRVLSDFVKGMIVEILSSVKHPEMVGSVGIATSCGILEGEIYIAINFSDAASGNYLETLSQIYFPREIKFLRQKPSLEKIE